MKISVAQTGMVLLAAAGAPGAQSAARLTDQLLSFARRQALQAEIHDLNAIAGNCVAMFGRTLNAAIRIETDFAADLSPIRVDLGQTENAVLNLIVNARDAMPAGGTLTLRTANDGDNVVLEVSDNGAGMDEATRSRAFEPFFTTKPMGRGSGLGLSQVYGFASQSGGDVEIISAPGAGTTVRLVLPRADVTGEAA